MKYTVILMYPDYLSENGPGETWCGSVEARDAAHAVRVAQNEIMTADANDPTDFLPISVFAGEHEDLISLWAEADETEKNPRAEYCNGYRCNELILPGQDHYGTPCGTYCPACLEKHMRKCDVCKQQFA